MSANSDETIGKLISEAMEKVGKEGVITVEEATSDYDREKLQERLAKIIGGVAVINIGAATETDYRGDDRRKAREEKKCHPCLPEAAWARTSTKMITAREMNRGIFKACPDVERCEVERDIEQLIDSA